MEWSAHRFANAPIRGLAAPRLWVWGVVIGLGFGAYWRWGWTWHAGVVAINAWWLLAFAVVDLEQRLVPNRLLALAAGATLLLGFLFRLPTLPAALTGAAIALGVFFIIASARPGAMGWGDVKLAGLIGLMVGFPNVLLALLAGVIAGGVAALALVVCGRATRRTSFAYAPYLALGAILALFLR